jgi:hypothetical protein
MAFFNRKMSKYCLAAAYLYCKRERQNDYRTQHPFGHMAAASKKDKSETEWPAAKFRQIRFVPFDIGTEIDGVLMKKLQGSSALEGLTCCDLKEFKNLLPGDTVVYEIPNKQ